MRSACFNNLLVMKMTMKVGMRDEGETRALNVEGSRGSCCFADLVSAPCFLTNSHDDAPTDPRQASTDVSTAVYNATIDWRCEQALCAITSRASPHAV
jgi:hypothetical protein